MTLQQMRYFIGAAESGSISEAAKRSFTAQSSISGAIKEVENTYGITAFVRDSKGVRLTRSGEELLINLKNIKTVWTTWTKNSMVPKTVL